MESSLSLSLATARTIAQSAPLIQTVHSLLRSLHLLPYADVLTAALSGGNR